jgi:putative transposase
MALEQPAAHISWQDGALVKVEPLLNIVKKNWKDFLLDKSFSLEIETLRKHERTGRPLGDIPFIEKLEKKLSQQIKPKRPGRKPKKAVNR